MRWVFPILELSCSCFSLLYLSEAQYQSLAQVTEEILWIQTLLFELGVPFKTPVVFCDNQSSATLAYNPVLHTRTKHIEIDVFFVRERVLTQTIVRIYSPSDLQTA